MVTHCVAYRWRWSNRQNKETKEKKISFFRFPKDAKKRKGWVTAVNRTNWAPNEESRICSAHFVEGWHSDDPNDVNYRPTLFSYKEKIPSESETHRSDRHTKRNLMQVIH